MKLVLVRSKARASVGAFALALAALMLHTSPASAQISGLSPSGVSVPHVGIYCVNSSGNDVVCQFGSGSAGGPATQSGPWNDSILYNGSVVSPTNLLGMTDVALDALINGGKLPVSIASLPTLPAGSNTIGAISNTAFNVIYNGNNVSPTNLFGVTDAALDALISAGALKVSLATLPALAGGNGGSVIGSVALIGGSATAGYVYLTPQSSTGLSTSSYLNAAASAMGTLVSTGAHALYGYAVCNAGTGAVYFRAFNLATAPTVGTSTPALRVLVPAGSCQSYNFDYGVLYALGLGFDVTSGSLADTDTGTISAANTVTVNVHYK